MPQDVHRRQRCGSWRGLSHDPRRDEGLDYATRMLQAGVAVELHNYAGTVHGFDLLIPSAKVSLRAVEDCVAAFRRATA